MYHASDHEAKPDPGGTHSEQCGEENAVCELMRTLGPRSGLFYLSQEHTVCLKCWTDRSGVDGLREGGQMTLERKAHWDDPEGWCGEGGGRGGFRMGNTCILIK